MFDPEEPLSRFEESARANQALRDYFAMGAGRSLRKLLAEYERQAAEIPGRIPPSTRWSTLAGWSCNHSWVERVQAQLEIQYKQEEAYWRERQIEIRQDDDRQSQRLRELVDKILDEAPSFIRQKRRIIRGQDGKPDTEVVTMALNANQATRALELASKLQRLSAEMSDPAKRIEIEVTRELEAVLARLEDKLDDDTYSRVLAAIAGTEETGETTAD